MDEQEIGQADAETGKGEPKRMAKRSKMKSKGKRSKKDEKEVAGDTDKESGPGEGKRLNIKKAIKHPGALHKDLGVPAGQKIPKSKIAAAAKGKGKTAQRARFAMTLSKMNMPRIPSQNG